MSALLLYRKPVSPAPHHNFQFGVFCAKTQHMLYAHNLLINKSVEDELYQTTIWLHQAIKLSFV